MHRKGFTLIEILLVLSGFVVLVGIVWGIYQGLFRIRTDVTARQLVIEQTYYTLERLHTLLEDFTIDYEEYWNRGVVGCNAESNIGPQGYCDIFTHYGNASRDTLTHKFYYCSSVPTADPTVFQGGVANWLGCNNALTSGKPQSFGQYAQHFRDRGDDVSGDGSVVGDADDRNIGLGPVAILDPENIPELYLISPDKTQRLFVRRALADTGVDLNNDDDVGPGESRYTLQILRLQGLDAGSNHDFAPGDDTVYDGQIDTRACDAAQGFFCSGPAVGGAYAGYSLPADVDDGRVDILDERLTVADRKLEIYPSKDPNYAWDDLSVQIQPYIRITMRTSLYLPARPSLTSDQIALFSFPIQTTFNTKTWYTK